jgi:hypothetical protein
MLERNRAIGDPGKKPMVSTMAVMVLVMSLGLGLTVDGAVQTTKVLYSAPLGSGDTFSNTDFVASVVNLDSTPVVVTVSFCGLNGGCDSNQNSDCVQETLQAQHGCSATFHQENGGFRYAKIEIVSSAKKIIALGQLSAEISLPTHFIKASVPAR